MTTQPPSSAPQRPAERRQYMDMGLFLAMAASIVVTGKVSTMLYQEPGQHSQWVFSYVSCLAEALLLIILLIVEAGSLIKWHLFNGRNNAK